MLQGITGRGKVLAREWYDAVTARMDALYLCSNPEMPCELTEFFGHDVVVYLGENWHSYLYNPHFDLSYRLDRDLYLYRDVEARIACFYVLERQVSLILKVSDPDVEKTLGKGEGVPGETRRTLGRLRILLKKLPPLE